jgi:hypothetical protein
MTELATPPPPTGTTGVDPPPGQCVACRYDLTGLSADRCPECGVVISREVPADRRPLSHLLLFVGAWLWGLGYLGVTLKTYHYGVWVEANDRLWRVGVAIGSAIHLSLALVALRRDTMMKGRPLAWQIAWWTFLLVSIALALPSCVAGWEGEPRS